MAQLAKAIVTLANVSTMQLTTFLLKAKVVQKPSPFKGELGSDACHFLAAFTMWALAQGTALNVIDQQGNTVNHCEMEWICVTLSYLQEDTAIWAAPAMEEFANGGIPFDSRWDRYHEQFKVQFETVDKAIDMSTVPEYAAFFKELMACTGYSTANL